MLVPPSKVRSLLGGYSFFPEHICHVLKLEGRRKMEVTLGFIATKEEI